MKQRTYSPEEAARIEARTQEILDDQNTRQLRFRTARRERIAAGKPEWTDCQQEKEVVCPHCGEWQPGEEQMDLDSMTPSGAQSQMFTLECPKCSKLFGCEAAVVWSFSTFQLMKEATDAETD